MGQEMVHYLRSQHYVNERINGSNNSNSHGDCVLHTSFVVYCVFTSVTEISCDVFLGSRERDLVYPTVQCLQFLFAQICHGRPSLLFGTYRI